MLLMSALLWRWLVGGGLLLVFLLDEEDVVEEVDDEEDEELEEDDTLLLLLLLFLAVFTVALFMMKSLILGVLAPFATSLLFDVFVNMLCGKKKKKTTTKPIKTHVFLCD